MLRNVWLRKSALITFSLWDHYWSSQLLKPWYWRCWIWTSAKASNSNEGECIVVILMHLYAIIRSTFRRLIATLTDLWTCYQDILQARDAWCYNGKKGKQWTSSFFKVSFLVSTFAKFTFQNVWLGLPNFLVLTDFVQIWNLNRFHY